MSMPSSPGRAPTPASANLWPRSVEAHDSQRQPVGADPRRPPARGCGMTPVRTPPSRSRSQDKALVPGEFLLTGEDFQNIAAMLHADAGIYLAETKATLVYSRLAKRLRALGLESFRDYCTLVAGSEGVGERQKMLAALTTNVTRFFREPHHFEHLKTHVLMPLAQAARKGRRVRLWSAASSSGQEPYSIALTV